MSAWLLVSGDFTPYGGMDMANYALASYLARLERGPANVHLVAHQVSPELAGFAGNAGGIPGVIPGVINVHRVPRPFGIHRLGEPLLRSAARRVQKQLASQDLCSLANGDRKSTRLNSSHLTQSRMPSSA